MRRTYILLATAATLGMAGTAQAQTAPEPLVRAIEQGLVITPGSSLAPATGFAHTHYHVLRPYGVTPNATGPSGQYETPASLACVYGLVPVANGCNPTIVTQVSALGSKAIAIVDAYDYPTAAADLQVYSTQFGLPAITADNFQVTWVGATKPKVDPTGGWEGEEALDIEMVHALAPNAKIILVEAKSASTADLVAAEKLAIQLVAAAGGGEVTNSWGGGETSNENSTASQNIFKGTNVTVFASAGDAPGTEWPSVMNNVVGVGGTTINRDASFNYINQTTWSISKNSSTGGGLSKFVPIPSFQSAVSGVVGTKRGVPDIALIGNPSSGVWTYTSQPGTYTGWQVYGGTSVAAPLAAAVVNAAGSFAASTTAELATIYANYGVTANYTDITSGKCLNAPSKNASVGYDLCTGIGAPIGLAGK